MTVTVAVLISVIMCSAESSSPDRACPSSLARPGGRPSIRGTDSDSEADSGESSVWYPAGDSSWEQTCAGSHGVDHWLTGSDSEPLFSFNVRVTGTFASPGPGAASLRLLSARFPSKFSFHDTSIY